MGWLTAITGALRLLAPHQAIKFGRGAYAQPGGILFGAIFWTLLGVVLCFFGYFR